MADQVVTKFQEDVKHLDMFLNREKVAISLKKTMMEYWKYQWKRTGGWSVGIRSLHLLKLLSIAKATEYSPIRSTLDYRPN